MIAVRFRPLPHLASALTLILVAACGWHPSPTPQTLADEWASLLPKAIDQASEFEREILEDGVVTAHENERAQEAYLECLEAAGLRLISVEVDDDGILQSLTYQSGADPSEAVAQQRIELECQARFYSLVEAGWLAVVMGGDSDEAYLARISRCLRARGHDVPPSPATGQELLDGTSEDINDDFRACAESTRYPAESQP